MSAKCREPIPHARWERKLCGAAIVPHAALALLLGCSDSASHDADASDVVVDTAQDAFDGEDADASADAPATDAAPDDSDVADADDTDADDADAEDAAPQLPPFRVVSFNTGSGKRPQDEGEVGFGPVQSEISDDHYGNGLAWKPIIADTAEWFAEVDADIVAFQEIFWPGECPEIPEELHTGFICEDDPRPEDTVVQMVLGDEYQVACHPGSQDKCVAVKRTFGTIEGCDGDLCLEGMRGTRVEGCGGGARIAAARIARLDGGPTINVVNVHATSGIYPEDLDCRVQEINRLFVGEREIEPLVNGDINLIIGDFNTDPGRLVRSDASAARWLDFVGEGHPFDFITEVGADAMPTYVLLNIDHVVAGGLTGSCAHAGITEGLAAPTRHVHYDHAPVVCTITSP